MEIIQSCDGNCLRSRGAKRTGVWCKSGGRRRGVSSRSSGPNPSLPGGSRLRRARPLQRDRAGMDASMPIWVVPRKPSSHIRTEAHFYGSGGIRDDRKGFHGAGFPGARKGSHQVLERERYLQKVHRPPRRRRRMDVLRRPADRQRQAAHRPHRDPRHQGPAAPLPDHEGQVCAAQGRLGHPRPAGGAGSGKAAGPGRQGADRAVRHRALHPGVQEVRLEVQGRMGAHVRARGLLGRYGKPLHHLRQQLHRIRVVEPEAGGRQGPAVQGPQGGALLPALRHRAVQPRGLPGLQGGQGALRGCAVQGRGPGQHLDLRLDHHALDAAQQRGAVREPRRDLREVRIRGPHRHHGRRADRKGAGRGRRDRQQGHVPRQRIEGPAL